MNADPPYFRNDNQPPRDPVPKIEEALTLNRSFLNGSPYPDKFEDLPLAIRPRLS
jgi:hypothetical protein